MCVACGVQKARDGRRHLFVIREEKDTFVFGEVGPNTQGVGKTLSGSQNGVGEAQAVLKAVLGQESCGLVGIGSLLVLDISCRQMNRRSHLESRGGAQASKGLDGRLWHTPTRGDEKDGPALGCRQRGNGQCCAKSSPGATTTLVMIPSLAFTCRRTSAAVLVTVWTGQKSSRWPEQGRPSLDPPVRSRF